MGVVFGLFMRGNFGFFWVFMTEAHVGPRARDASVRPPSRVVEAGAAAAAPAASEQTRRERSRQRHRGSGAGGVVMSSAKARWGRGEREGGGGARSVPSATGLLWKPLRGRKN